MWWLRLALVCTAFLPVLAHTCDEVDRQQCKEDLGELVTYRTTAIERAFGELVSVLPEKIAIKFVGPKDIEYKRYSRKVAYDLEQETLIIPRYLLSTRMPKPLRASVAYWPFYQNELYRETFPVILAVDNALWGAYLQEAAQDRGLTWPHMNCGSVDLAQRLPCEMLVEGILLSGLYRGMKRGARQGDWLRAVVRRTWLPALLTFTLFAAAGYMLQRAAPRARSIGEAWRMVGSD